MLLLICDWVDSVTYQGGYLSERDFLGTVAVLGKYPRRKLRRTSRGLLGNSPGKAPGPFFFQGKAWGFAEPLVLEIGQPYQVPSAYTRQMDGWMCVGGQVGGQTQTCPPPSSPKCKARKGHELWLACEVHISLTLLDILYISVPISGPLECVACPSPYFSFREKKGWVWVCGEDFYVDIRRFVVCLRCLARVRLS